MVCKGAQPLQAETAPQSSVPWADPSESWLSPRTDQRVATTPTTLDVAVLYGGRGRLLRVAEVAEQLGVCNATVHRLCESGELPHLRVVNSIRVRPKDLAEYVGGGPPPQS